jgi:peptide/nickel transport system permease protein
MVADKPSELAGSSMLAPLLRQLRRNKLAMVGIAFVLLVMIVAVVAPVLPIPDPNATRPSARLAPPGTEGYILGSDQLGRDILSRIIWGGRVSLAVGFGATLIAMIVGSALGLISGYFMGITDHAIMRFVDVLMAFPYILLAIALVAALGPGLFNAMIAIAVVNFSFYARGIRGAVLVLREADFIEAARSIGARDSYIIWRHVWPNIVPPILVFASLTVGWMITETAGLSFIGLGAQPPTADWGTMLSDGRQYLMVAYHVTIIPGIVILLVVLSLNLLGDGLRDALDPRLRN